MCFCWLFILLLLQPFVWPCYLNSMVKVIVWHPICTLISEHVSTWTTGHDAMSSNMWGSSSCPRPCTGTGSHRNYRSAPPPPLPPAPGLQINKCIAGKQLLLLCVCIYVICVWKTIPTGLFGVLSFFVRCQFITNLSFGVKRVNTIGIVKLWSNDISKIINCFGIEKKNTCMFSQSITFIKKNKKHQDKCAVCLFKF